MIHATPVFVRHYAEWPDDQSGRVTVTVGNYGGAPIVDVVGYAEIGERVEWQQLPGGGGLKPQATYPWEIRFEGLDRGDYMSSARRDSTEGPAARVWIVFRDVEQRWWQKEEGSLPIRLHGPSPEALGDRRSSWT